MAVTVFFGQLAVFTVLQVGFDGAAVLCKGDSGRILGELTVAVVKPCAGLVGAAGAVANGVVAVGFQWDTEHLQALIGVDAG